MLTILAWAFTAVVWVVMRILGLMVLIARLVLALVLASLAFVWLVHQGE